MTGFSNGAPGPNDSACPVTRYRPEFVPSRLLDEARSGWYPRGIRHCIGCELCSPTPELSFPKCADTILLQNGPREDYIPRAFGGAHDAIVSIQIQGISKQNRLGWLTDDIHIAGENEQGKVALFVGCAPYYDALLADDIGFRATEDIRAAVGLLNSVRIKPVVLSDEVCCGGDRIHAGDLDGFLALGKRNLDLLKSRGVKTIVTTCDDCRYTLANRYPGRIPGWDFEVVRLSDFLVRRGGKLAFMPARDTIAIQPPDRYSDPDGVDSVRKLLASVPELIVAEIEPGFPSTFGGWGQFDAVSKQLETDFLKAAEATRSSVVLIPGTRMLVRLMEGRRPGSWEETSIKIRGLYGFLENIHTVAEEFTGA
jgi:hypothetical protein